ncbi:MAG: hypothetical protein KJO75_13840, partial [Dactylosporangium sp.]|nr:hypothetical protein [Dactylosporangium sp.]
HFNVPVESCNADLLANGVAFDGPPWSADAQVAVTSPDAALVVVTIRRKGWHRRPYGWAVASACPDGFTHVSCQDRKSGVRFG